MQIKELKRFIKKEDGRLRKHYRGYKDEREWILTRVVKLIEELGELYDEVLCHNTMQRKEKSRKRNTNNLSGEFADVVITTLLLAEAMGVSIEKALKEKIGKVNKRYNR